MVKFISLQTGSAGNCFFLGTETEGLIIDAGVSLRKMKKILEANHLSYDSFDSILVTHDHMDHIRNLDSYCKKLCKCVYLTDELLHAGTYCSYPSAIVMNSSHVRNCAKTLQKDAWNDIHGFKVRYFEVPHDATQTVGYSILVEGHKFVIMTDLGRMTDEAADFARQADTLVIESNYDTDMLMSGSYPPELKKRIFNGHGHLSNDDCASAIKRVWHKGLRNIFLCHISDNNNTPEKAYKSALSALDELGVERGTVNLRALPRLDTSNMIIL